MRRHGWVDGEMRRQFELQSLCCVSKIRVVILRGKSSHGQYIQAMCARCQQNLQMVGDAVVKFQKPSSRSVGGKVGLSWPQSERERKRGRKFELGSIYE